MSRLELREVHSAHANNVSLVLDAGLHWVLCPEPDVATHWIELCAGLRPSQRGRVLLDEALVASLKYQDRGVLPATVTFPHLPVQRLLSMALTRLGAAQTAAKLLAEWDLGALGATLGSDLDLDDARRVALLLALASPRPRLLALHDVFGLGLPREKLVSHLTKFAENGTVVMLTALSTELADPATAHAHLGATSTWVLRYQLVRAQRSSGADTTAVTGTTASGHLGMGSVATNTLFVVCSDARALSERLSRDPRISALRLDERDTPHLVELTGASPEALGGAVADIALEGHIDIRHMTPTLSPLFSVPARAPAVPEPAAAAADPAPPDEPLPSTSVGNEPQ